MNPQVITTIRWVITLVAGILASNGMISDQTKEYLGSPEVLTVIGAVGAAASLAWGLWRNRPHGIIKDAAALPQVDAVVVKPRTASEIPVGNVVGSVTEAERLPGVVR